MTVRRRLEPVEVPRPRLFSLHHLWRLLNILNIHVVTGRIRPCYHAIDLSQGQTFSQVSPRRKQIWHVCIVRFRIESLSGTIHCTMAALERCLCHTFLLTYRNDFYCFQSFSLPIFSGRCSRCRPTELSTALLVTSFIRTVGLHTVVVPKI